MRTAKFESVELCLNVSCRGGTSTLRRCECWVQMRKAVSKVKLKAVDLTTRELILSASARVFLANGYELTSMDLIASESGAGRRTVYNHFESKKALFDATVAYLWEQMPLKRIVDQLGNSESPDRALKTIGDAIAGFWAPDDAVALMRMIIAEGARFPELIESLVKFGRAPARGAVVNYVKRLAAGKAFKIVDPDEAALQFISLVNGPLVWNRVIGGGPAATKERRDRVVDEAVAMFLARYRLRNG
jgi:AcrR family transcriptional regulator